MTLYDPDRRLHPRYAVRDKLVVSIFAPPLRHAYGEVANLSEGGACIHSELDISLETKVLLRIRLPGGDDPFVAEARVVWRAQRNARDLPFAHGLKFAGLEQQQHQKLKDLLSHPALVPEERPAAPPPL